MALGFVHNYYARTWSISFPSVSLKGTWASNDVDATYSCSGNGDWDVYLTYRGELQCNKLEGVGGPDILFLWLGGARTGNTIRLDDRYVGAQHDGEYDMYAAYRMNCMIVIHEDENDLYANYSSNTIDLECPLFYWSY